MPRTCTVCTHTEALQINEALLAGRSLRDIAGHFGPTRSALSRHIQAHLSRAVVKAKEKVDGNAVQQAESMFERVENLNRETKEILDRVRTKSDRQSVDLALKAIARLESQIVLQARLTGKLNTGRGGRPSVSSASDNLNALSVHQQAQIEAAAMSDQQKADRCRQMAEYYQSRADAERISDSPSQRFQ